jgi:hypothetical protein
MLAWAFAVLIAAMIHPLAGLLVFAGGSALLIVGSREA